MVFCLTLKHRKRRIFVHLGNVIFAVEIDIARHINSAKFAFAVCSKSGNTIISTVTSSWVYFTPMFSFL